MRRALFLPISALMALGCGGVDTLRIKSTPNQAKLFVDGQYVGTTPQSVPAKWWSPFPFIVFGDHNKLLLQADGYHDVRRSVTPGERFGRFLSGDYVSGSEFGHGSTYTYDFVLEPLSPARGDK